MLDIPSGALSERIDTIVRQFIKTCSPSRAIEPEQDLQELGLTSLDMVNLMLAVEAEFDLTIPGAKLLPANFRSIRSIEGLVLELTE